MYSMSGDKSYGNKGTYRLREQGLGGRCHFRMMVTEGLAGELVFKSRPEGNEKMSHVVG